MGSTQLDEPDPLDPDIIQRLDNRFSYRDVPDDYYTNEDGDEVCALETIPVCSEYDSTGRSGPRDADCEHVF